MSLIKSFLFLYYDYCVDDFVFVEDKVCEWNITLG